MSLQKQVFDGLADIHASTTCRPTLTKNVSLRCTSQKTLHFVSFNKKNNVDKLFATSYSRTTPNPNGFCQARSAVFEERSSTFLSSGWICRQILIWLICFSRTNPGARSLILSRKNISSAKRTYSTTFFDLYFYQASVGILCEKKRNVWCYCYNRIKGFLACLQHLIVFSHIITMNAHEYP